MNNRTPFLTADLSERWRERGGREREREGERERERERKRFLVHNLDVDFVLVLGKPRLVPDSTILMTFKLNELLWAVLVAGINRESRS